MRLLVLIRDLQYNKSDRKQLIMAIIKANFDLYSCAQGGRMTDENYKICASTVDTINANGGNAGLHPSVFKKYFQSMKDKGVEESGKELAVLTSDELKAFDEAATLSAKGVAQGEYLVCLCILLTDHERYGPLQTQLDNNFLMGEQEYPSNVLTAKSLMTDSVLATGAVKLVMGSIPSDGGQWTICSARCWPLNHA